MILYALLCGTLPFDDENIPNLFKKIKVSKYLCSLCMSGASLSASTHVEKIFHFSGWNIYPSEPFIRPSKGFNSKDASC